MTGGGGGGGNTQTIQQADPWSGQQPYLKDLWSRASDLPRQEPYPGPAVVPFSPYTRGGMRRILAQSQKGVTPVFEAGEEEAMRTLGGGYLDVTAQPAFQQAFRGAAREIIPQVDAAALASGRYGGGLSRMHKMQALGDAYSDLWAPLYQSERDRMSRTMMAAPSMSQARRQQEYYDIDRAMGVGGMQEARGQAALEDAKARWYYQQEAPYRQLGAIAPIIGGTSVGGVSQTDMKTQSPGMNPVAAGLGGGMMGAYLGGPAGITGLGLSPLGGFGIGAGLGLLASMM